MNLSLLLFLGFFLVLWVSAVWHLGTLWLAFPQYHYGVAVPFLMLLMLNKRLAAATAGKTDPISEATPRNGEMRATFDGLARREIGAWVFLLLFASCALLLPVRVVHEANPLWRFSSWSLAFLVVLVTLCSVYLTGGRRWVRELTFPIGYFLAAVPWPSGIEQPVIQGLAGLNTAVSVEIVNSLGIPALRHGNIVEIASGLVGVDDACSGVRSVQTTFMLSLFLVGWHRLKSRQAFTLVLAGLALAFTFNVLRTVLLTWVAASSGISAIARWHDLTGVSIGVACFGCVALIALWFHPEDLKRRWSEFNSQELPEERELRLQDEEFERQRSEHAVREAEAERAQKAAKVLAEAEAFLAKERAKTHHEFVGSATDEVGPEQVAVVAREEAAPLGTSSGMTAHAEKKAADNRASTPGENRQDPQADLVAAGMPRFNFVPFRRIAVAVFVWVLLVEIVTEAWFQLRESSMPPAASWTYEWPTNKPSFQLEPLSQNVVAAMRCDQAVRATWTDEQDRPWLVNYLRWEPGHTSAHLARLHSPESCLPTTGLNLKVLRGLRRLGPLEPPLPFRAYQIEGYGGQTGYVYYCRSGDRRDDETAEDESGLAWPQRLRAVWKGRATQGMTVLEIVVWGRASEVEAELAVQRELSSGLKRKTG